jgi:radical SAM superfamily enzyme YgiQ (UPF0313 family)
MGYPDKRILFSTAVSRMPDYFGACTGRMFRNSLPTPPFGLRFLQANLPCIAVLEHPSWRRFKRSLRGVHVLGISYFMKDIPVVEEMVRLARDAGVEAVWGGGYGVLCHDSGSLFDRVFTGYAEPELHRLIYQDELPRLRHPALDTSIGVRFTPARVKYGFLFSTRGCNHACTFCQTPAYVDGVSTIPLESIDEALRGYRERGVRFLFLMDENFMARRDHAREVVKLLAKHDIAWGACTRAENLAGRVAELRSMGLKDCLIGLESLNQSHLDDLRRRSTATELLGVMEELHRHDIYVHITYMIGFPGDTAEDVRADIALLETARADSGQICVLTPFPQTPLFDEIQARYGVRADPTLYDTYHLAWNHPRISPREMEALLQWARRRVNPYANVFRGVRKLHRNRILDYSRPAFLGPPGQQAARPPSATAGR